MRGLAIEDDEQSIEKKATLRNWNSFNINLRIENPLYNQPDQREIEEYMRSGKPEMLHFMQGLYGNAAKFKEQTKTQEEEKKSSTKDIDFEPKPERSTNQRGKSHFLGIAIDQYEHMARLNSCVKDVTDIHNLLVERYDFEPESATLLLDEQATRRGILKSLEDYSEKLGENDSLVMMYSAHGEGSQKDNDGFIIPVDAKDNLDYVSLNDIKNRLEKFKAKHIFMIFDSGFSGSILNRGINKEVGGSENLPSRIALTSGRKELASDGASGENSPFVRALLNVLLENKEKLGVRELSQFVSENIATHGNQFPDFGTFGSGDYGGQYYFYPKEMKVADESAPKKVTVEEEKSVKQDQNNPPIQIIKEYNQWWPPLSYGEEPSSILWHLEQPFTQLAMARDYVWNKINKKEISGKIRIAHIDTGYNKHSIIDNNPNIRTDLARSFVKGENPDSAIDLPGGMDGHGLGTLALLAGGHIPDVGYMGAIPFMEIVPIRIFDTPVILDSATLAKAIEYAISIDCEVICGAMAGKPDQKMAEVINKAYEQGIVMVFAAGNHFAGGIASVGPSVIMYPARYPRVIAACGACYNQLPYNFDTQPKQDKKPNTPKSNEMESNFGPEEAMHYALAAYAVNLAWATGDGFGIKTNGGGTSVATPQIAAAVALYIAEHQGAMRKKGYYEPAQRWKKVEAVRYALFHSADKTYTAYKKYYGNGILKAWNALQINCPDIPNEVKAAEAESSYGGFTETMGSFFE